MAEGKTSPERASNRAGSSTRRGLVNGNGLTNGLTNGIGRTNGRGRTNGLVNGLGRINGTGKTNGLTNGIVNGNGLVNGRGLVNGTRRSLRTNAFGVVTHRDIKVGVSLTLLFILVLPSFYLLMSTPTPRPAAVQIDGAFGDWNTVPKYAEDNGGAVDNIAFTQYALVDDSNTLFIYFQVRGQVFTETQGYDGFYAFIDSDGNPATGYWPGDLGAEYAVKVIGIGGKVANSDIMKFESTGDRLNWTAWKGASSASAAASSNSVELAVNLMAADLDTTYTVRLAASDFEGHTTLASLRMGKEHGALSVEQVPSSLMTALTPSSNEILRLKMHAQGKKVVIEDFAASATWQCYPPNLWDYLQLPNRVELEAGEQEDILVGVDLAGFASKSPMWLNLTGLDVDVPLTINGDGGVGYVNQAPQNKVVDGWFGDWLPPFQTDTSPPIPDPNVDIAAYSSNTSHGTGYDKSVFYVEFLGKAMAGDATPAKVMWAQAGQPSPPAAPAPVRRVSGEDRLTIFIDTNSTDTQGCQAGTLTADFKLELVGHQRKVDSKILYICSGAVWIQVPGAVLLAMTSGSKMEISVDLSVLGTLDNPMMLVESTDWSGIGDIPTPIDLGTRSGSKSDGTRSDDFPHVLANPLGVDEVTSIALTLAPTLDGRCGDPAYSIAGHETNASFQFWVGHQGGFVWFCIDFHDHTNDIGDYAEIVLDTNYNNGTNPQTDDRRYRIDAGGNTFSFRQRGDGLNWVNCDSAGCTDGDLGMAKFYLSDQNYEFQIMQSNVWGSGFHRAGFAIHMHNDTFPATNYWWGSWVVDINVPNTWGHLDIPEFPAILVPILIVVAVARPWRKRRRA